MFDHVDMQGGIVVCPCCGHHIDDVWQTKQGDCDLGWIAWFNVDQFCTICKGCNELVEMHVEQFSFTESLRDSMGLRDEKGQAPALYHQFMISYDVCERSYEQAVPVTWVVLPRDAL